MVLAAISKETPQLVSLTNTCMELGVKGMMFKIKPTAKLAVLAQAALLLFWGATASAQEGNRLQDIQVQSLPGQRVELKLIMSDTAPEPLAFTIENPARIALDLPNTALGLTSRRRDVNIGPLNTVLTADSLLGRYR